MAGDTAADGFAFAGFLSHKAQERSNELSRRKDVRQSTVIFEAPHRTRGAGRRDGRRARRGRRDPARHRLSRADQPFEQVVTLAVGDLASWLAADANHRRGEFVLVLHAAPPRAVPDDALPADAERTLRVLLRELPLKQASSLTASCAASRASACMRRRSPGARMRPRPTRMTSRHKKTGGPLERAARMNSWNTPGRPDDRSYAQVWIARRGKAAAASGSGWDMSDSRLG